MRATITGVLLFALLLLFVVPAQADTLSVSVDVPVTYSFTETTLKDPSSSGALVAVTLPFLVGLGYENYKVTGKLTDPTLANPDQDFEYKVAMYDIYVDIPFPYLNLRVGGGAGKGEFDLTPVTGDTYDSASLTQLFFNVGVPFWEVFDAHVGYHKISGDADNQTNPGKNLTLDAGMATVGLKVGF